MNIDHDELKKSLRDMPPVSPGKGFTKKVLRTIESGPQNCSLSSMGFAFHISGFFFLVLFLVLSLGIRQMAGYGAAVDFLYQGRAASLVVSFLMFGAGLCVRFGGKKGKQTACLLTGLTIMGMAVYAVILSAAGKGFDASTLFSAYWICGAAIAAILLKGIISHEKNHEKTENTL